MKSKIFRSTVLVAAIVLICSLGVTMGVLLRHFSSVRIGQLKDELSLAATATEQYGNAFLENVEASRFRVTWIDLDGTVLFDTQVDQSTMENHANREEIMEAFSLGEGSAVRNSSTLTEQTFYEAKRLSDGTVLRISTNQQSAWVLMMGMLFPVAIIAILAIALSSVLAGRMAIKIVEPLNNLDLEQPLKNNVYEEISPLLRRIHRQHLEISEHMETLRRKTDEFQQITDNMQEGLLLLSHEGTVLSINPAAKKLFDAEDSCLGKSFLTLDRSAAMRSALNSVLDKGSAYLRHSHNGRQYQLDFSRIQSDGHTVGAVILAFDITERLSAEQMRREFSANVSHELKTPLQGIIGSAELLESGMVKSEDAPRFIGHIRREAARLVALVEDILRLSQLDEGVALPTEEVDMLSLAEEVKAILLPSAEEKNVEIVISGESFSLQGVRRLLHELLYNLCENGIKYNVPGGKLTVSLGRRSIKVSDTGIGIAPEHRERVFERFYRVDKSHSKLSGGTGLGLSIVKHAAAYHKATISLESAPGKGTSIEVKF